MAQRKATSMAQPSSKGRKTTARGKTATPQPAAMTVLSKIGLVLWSWIKGPTGQQLLAVALILFGLLTLVAITGKVEGVNSGVLIRGWVRFLVFAFGWGAYPMAALIVGVGLLWLRHLVHQPMVWRWRPVLGFELALIALLTLTATLITQRSWGLVESGRGGGLVGWAFYVLLNDALGVPITAFLMVVVLLIGLALAFDVTKEDLRLFTQRLAEIVAALRARQTAPPPAESTAQTSSSIAVSPVPKRQETPKPVSPAPASGPEPAVPPLEPQIKPQIKPQIEPQMATSSLSVTAAPAGPAQPEVALPPLTLLKEARRAGSDPEDIRRKSRIIEETLAQFGVPAQVTEVRPGPTVTQFGVAPGYISRGTEGEEQRKVRVSQIASLSDDLALALAAKSLRIEAPVPGRAVVGIEVPNTEIALVSLRSVLESENFRKCGKPLCFAVGMDVAGSAIVADLAAMPHLLVAGTTGSGKSVFVKALAASLIMHNAPQVLRLVAIDPKMVELSHLNGLPHLLGQAESDIENIIRALRWVAHEMDRRYKLFSAAVARNLDDYNRKAARQGAETLPRIVVLIDELADLMMSTPEETERTLTRIAQMARATGIHLVVATQRPSTDVVTGLIKANFPARVSFATTSNVDSRVIIDTPGAESLLGRGDMLFLPPDASAPLRVQGCYISDTELEGIIHFWQKSAGATPAQPPWKALSQAKGPDSLRLEGQPEDADLLERAVALARSHGRISTSGLQRQLRISYPRAARLMEEMEHMGLVGPQESAGRKRHVILGGDDDD
ncbi:MAG TPA: DNA translocase FtsK 4TM domain-containing protein [Anaerolineae bacterium]|nr:DNA translocase FtsK 4TM domain-containing protein [Anaerolineae bacterium]HQH38748.1 DNA translocase FtsK 4TM domain-containing protein [Anaerolineae bacterium]